MQLHRKSLLPRELVPSQGTQCGSKAAACRQEFQRLLRAAHGDLLVVEPCLRVVNRRLCFRALLALQSVSRPLTGPEATQGLLPSMPGKPAKLTFVPGTKAGSTLLAVHHLGRQYTPRHHRLCGGADGGTRLQSWLRGNVPACRQESALAVDRPSAVLGGSSYGGSTPIRPCTIH